MIAPKVAFKINVVALGFCWEGLVVGRCGLLLIVGALARIIEHLFDAAVKLALEHAHGVNGVLGDKPGKLGVLLPQIIN